MILLWILLGKEILSEALRTPPLYQILERGARSCMSLEEFQESNAGLLLGGTPTGWGLGPEALH